ncbi:MAG: radical SAM protein, partial [Planctomycetes bacterium]|nr:radical SAM protein [Planctomycetota bacterium]
GRFAPERHGLGPRASASWRELATLTLPVVAAVEREATATGILTKRALRLGDDRTIESVHLPMGRGRTSLCLSTQVGCARACTFCATGRLGLLRNLTAGEIVAQVTLACREQRPDTLVFMGMGEPLDNLEALLGALAVLTDRHGLAYAQDRLTVCTVGHVPGIAALRRFGSKRLGLALSLNAADDALRRELMPRTRWPLAEIQRALRDYRQRKNLALGLHWCLLPGINDGAADARAIARFAAPLGRVLVHVIPYNPIDPGPPIDGGIATAPGFRAPDAAEIERFVARLRAEGLAVRRRITKGRSVAGACGQLAGGPPAPPSTWPTSARPTST